MLRRKRKRIDADDVEEVARDLVFDSGASYNMIDNMISEEGPATKRTDRSNCLAVLQKTDGTDVAVWPDSSLRRLNICELQAKF